MNRLALIICDHCDRQLGLDDIALEPDPDGFKERLLCKWCWSMFVFRRQKKAAGLLDEPEPSEDSSEEVTA